MKEKIKAHFIDIETDEMVRQYVIYFPPRVGDELRFSEKSFYLVETLIWVFDEPEQPYQRLNIGISKIEV